MFFESDHLKHNFEDNSQLTDNSTDKNYQKHSMFFHE